MQAPDAALEAELSIGANAMPATVRASSSAAVQVAVVPVVVAHWNVVGKFLNVGAGAEAVVAGMAETAVAASRVKRMVGCILMMWMGMWT